MKMKEIKVILPGNLYKAFAELRKKSVVNGRQMTNGELALVAITLFVAVASQESEVNQA